MRTFNQLQEESKSIYAFLDIPTEDDILQYTEKGNQLAVYINRTGQMLAEAKYLLNESMNKEVVQLVRQLISSQYSAKVQNTLVESLCKEERMLVDFIEQLNKTAKYQLEWSRTGISKIKEEMKYNNLQI